MPEFKTQQVSVTVSKPVSLAEVHLLVRMGEYGLESKLGARSSMKYVVFGLSDGNEKKEVIRFGKVPHSHKKIVDSFMGEVSSISSLVVEVHESGSIMPSTSIGTVLNDYEGHNRAKGLLEVIYGSGITFSPKQAPSDFEPLLQWKMELPSIEQSSESKPTYVGQVELIQNRGDYVLERGRNLKYLVLEISDKTGSEKIIRFGSMNKKHDDIIIRAREEVASIPGVKINILEPGGVSHKGSEICIEDYNDGIVQAQALLRDAYDGLTLTSRRAPEVYESLRRR